MELTSLHKELPPATRDSHNWDAIKMRYELLHEDLIDLARIYHIAPVFLDRVAESEKWERQEIPDIVKAVAGQNAADVTAAIRNRVEVIQIYKELALLSTMLEIESSLVSNLQNALKDNVKLKGSPKDLKLLVDSYITLTSRQRIYANDREGDGGKKSVKVSYNIDTREGGSDVDS